MYFWNLWRLTREPGWAGKLITSASLDFFGFVGFSDRQHHIPKGLQNFKQIWVLDLFGVFGFSWNCEPRKIQKDSKQIQMSLHLFGIFGYFELRARLGRKVGNLIIIVLSFLFLERKPRKTKGCKKPKQILVLGLFGVFGIFLDLRA